MTQQPAGHPAFLIRVGRPADAEAIADANVRMALETEDLHLDPETILAGVKAALDDHSRATYFVADAGGRIAGQLMITHEWSDWRNGDIWWIQSVYVYPEFRRQGVFRALYDRVRDLARKEAVGFRLYVENSNSGAQGTYASLGMHMTGYSVMEEMF
jgi:GNAT superfamily N-acetyltransferase